MFAINRLGLSTVKFAHSFVLFFSFIGHLYYAFKEFIFRRLSISWSNVTKILFYSGAALVVPLVIITSLVAISLALNIHSIFTHYNLNHKALAVTESLLIQDLDPLILAFVLCVQSALNLISHRVKITKHYRSVEEVVLDYILPIMIGVYTSIVLLFIYTFLATFLSIFLSYYYLASFTLKEYLSHLNQSLNFLDISHSIMKTLLYGTIVSLTTGYYYYQVAVNHMRSRKGVSRILTRGCFWLALASVYGKYISY